MKFLLIFLLFIISITNASHDQNYLNNKLGQSEIEKTNVLIIGAGISGLEAARLLEENGINTIVLEGRNRIGGRIWSVPLKNNMIFDAGAAWIHGLNGSIPGGIWENPLWKLIQPAGIKSRATDLDDFRIFNLGHENNDIVHDWYKKYLDYAKNKYLETDTNETLLFYANEFSQINDFTEQDKKLFFSHLHVTIENQEGADMNSIDGRALYQITSNHYGDEHVFHETGYISVINYIAKDVPDIRLGKTVTKIDYSNVPVKVYTDDDHVYEANYVLLTVPLGVLKERKISFLPELPKWKQNAIDRIGFGLMNKIILLWDNAWWTETEYFFQRVDERANHFSFWINANTWNDRPAMVSLVVGKEAERLENLSDEKVIEEALRAVQDMYPNHSIPKPIDTYVTRWKADNFTYGSYSYISNKQKRQDPGYLAEPIKDRLLFAGEATTVDLYGFTHGALMSARREVTRLIYEYEIVHDHTITNMGSMTFSSMSILLICFLVHLL